MLVLSDNCNLACSYCYENHKKNSMDFIVAKDIIDREFKEIKDKDIKIFFFGGEPFLNFNTLQMIYDYVEKTYYNYNITYAVTTNGTLVHNDVQNWLYERRNKFEITLSIDGTAEMHNRNRRYNNGQGSFEKIDLNFFILAWPGCISKMTISKDTIADFADGVIFLESMGFTCKANFASGVDFELNKTGQIIHENMIRLAEYYSSNDKKLCYMLDLNLKSILNPLDKNFRYCGAGNNRHCYNAEGDGWYPCQGLMPMSVGDNEEIFKKCSFEAGSVMELSPCRSCRFIRICKTCYAMNYSSTKDVWTPDSQMCFLNKACMLTSAKIQYNRMKKSGTEDPVLVKAISYIVQDLNHIFD